MFSPELARTINEELRWREIELSLAKLQLQRSTGDVVLFRFSYRSFAAMTYAHFEAFTKNVVAQSMKDIFDSGVRWSECRKTIRENLFASALRAKLVGFSNAQITDAGCSGSRLIDDLDPPSLDIILECSNMNPKNFFWAIASVGLDEGKFAFARGDIGQLTSLRHRCAHGEKLSFDASKAVGDLARDMYGLQSRILYLMHFLSVELLDHFKNKSFEEI